MKCSLKALNRAMEPENVQFHSNLGGFAYVCCQHSLVSYVFAPMSHVLVCFRTDFGTFSHEEGMRYHSFHP